MILGYLLTAIHQRIRWIEEH